MTNSIVHWKELAASREFANVDAPLIVPLGKAESGEAVCVDLYLLRNLLICGVAESGKTNLVHAILTSLLMRSGPEKLRLIIMDPKQVEYQAYNGLAHLLTPVITDSKKAILALKWLKHEVDRRLRVLQEHNMRSIEAYHSKIMAPALKCMEEGTPHDAVEAMPYVIAVIDELSIPMAAYHREIEAGIGALAHAARATGILLIVTTSRPDAQALPVALRDLFAARIALHLPASQSRSMVGDASAEKLATGGALYRPNPMTPLIHMQTPRITDDEIDSVLETIASTYPTEQIGEGFVRADEYFGAEPQEPTSIFSAMDEEADDDKFAEAVEAVREAGQASTSYLQRKLGIGYSRAARLIDLLEEHGVIGPGDGAKPREVL